MSDIPPGPPFWDTCGIPERGESVSEGGCDMMYDRPTVHAMPTDRPQGTVTFPVTIHLGSDLLDPLFDYARTQNISIEDAVQQAVRLALFPPILIVKLDSTGRPSLELVPAGSARGG